jgi:hypothetical protein
MEVRFSRRVRTPVTQLARSRPGLSPNESWARSHAPIKGRMQDRSTATRRSSLATHGRTIHWVIHVVSDPRHTRRTSARPQERGRTPARQNLKSVAFSYLTSRPSLPLRKGGEASRPSSPQGTARTLPLLRCSIDRSIRDNILGRSLGSVPAHEPGVSPGVPCCPPPRCATCRRFPL